MTVTLACNCRVKVDEKGQTPMCLTHNERRVKGVKVPAPRITAVGCNAKGPLVRHAS
jgi:hypothetical protein